MYTSKTSVAFYLYVVQPVRTVGYFGGMYWGGVGKWWVVIRTLEGVS